MFTYGPGAVIESPSGPVVVRDLLKLKGRLEEEGGFKTLGLEHFEIEDPRLTGRPPFAGSPTRDWQIFKLPANAEIPGLPEAKPIYPTVPFPLWCQCEQHGILYGGTFFRMRRGCPMCYPDEPTTPEQQLERLARAGRQATRFVMACLNGHLDEVPWQEFVHRGRDRGSCPDGAKPSHLKMTGMGGSLAEVSLECPADGCKASRSLVELFRESKAGAWPCTGRHPQREGNDEKEACGRGMEIIQRGAAALFFAETRSAVTIADHGSGLADLLKRLAPYFDYAFSLLRAAQQEVTKDLLCNCLPKRAVSEPEIAELRDRWEEAFPEIERIVSKAPDSRSLKEAELDRLENAAHVGAPRIQSRRKDDPPLFEVPGDRIRANVRGLEGRLEFRVAPVTRLREVVVQVGFRRVKQDPDQSRLVESRLEIPQKGGAKIWYPGVERFGGKVGNGRNASGNLQASRMIRTVSRDIRLKCGGTR
jgi:hypothetical protein